MNKVAYRLLAQAVCRAVEVVSDVNPENAKNEAGLLWL